MKVEVITKVPFFGLSQGQKNQNTDDNPKYFAFFSKDGSNLALTIEQIKERSDLFDIKEIYTPEDVKEGSYWMDNNNNIFRIAEYDGTASTNWEITWEYIDGRKNHSMKAYPRLTDGAFRIATTPEIESALIKEAERRGFKIGTKYISARTGGEATIKQLPKYYDNSYGIDKDMLTDGWGGCIYYQGKWAEIIEPEKEEKKESSIPEIIRMLDETISFINDKKANEKAIDDLIKVRSYLKLKNLEA